MKRFLGHIFNRRTLIIVAILLQLIVSCMLPVVLSDITSAYFKKFYISFDLVFQIVGIFVFISIVNSNMQIEGQLTWAILLLLFPVFGVVLYLIAVRHKPARRYQKFFKMAKQEISSYNNLSQRTEQDVQQLKQQLGEYFGQFEYIHSSSGLKTYANTDVKYLASGEKFCEELINEIKNAKRYIFMEYFIIERGKLWNDILNALIEKVQQGVEVRVMYDDLGTINKLPSNYAKRLNKLGINCVKFNVFAPLASGVHNNRDHRKMTIIDNKIGFMSGLNMADEYANLKSAYGHWKDTGVKITGDAVKNMLIMFLEMFDVHNRHMEDFTSFLSDEQVVPNATGYVCPFGDGPKYSYKEHIAENVYLNIINQAQHYMYITTPYLIIDHQLTNALCNAALRGVDVRIITPHIPDKKFIFKLTRSSYNILQQSGVKIFEYTPGFIHSKQILSDDKIAMIGTINLDYRSLLHHYECGTLMYNTACLADIKSDFEALFNKSQDMAGFKQGKITKLFCAMCKIFTPML